MASWQGAGRGVRGLWCEDSVGSVGMCGEEKRRLCQPSSLGVAGRFLRPIGLVVGVSGPLGMVPSAATRIHLTLLVHHPREWCLGPIEWISHPAPSPWVELGITQGVVWSGVVRCVMLGCLNCAMVRRGVQCCVVLCCALLCCAITEWCGVLQCAVAVGCVMQGGDAPAPCPVSL